MYRDAPRRWIRQAKFHENLPALGALEALAPRLMLPQVDLITAVPTPSTRLRQRGLNLAWQLARSLAQSQRLPLRPLLQAPAQRAEQLGLSRQARQRNGAFQALQSISGASVLLVDDVLTTGSTLRAATQCLLQAGAQRVQVAALCRTPRPQANPDSRA